MKPKWPPSIFEVFDKLIPRLSIYRAKMYAFLASPDVTVIWVSLSFGCPRTQIPSVLGTQNTESLKLGQVKSFTSLLKTQLSSY